MEQILVLFESAPPLVKGLVAIALFLLSGKGLWEFLGKWLDARAGRDTREMAQGESREVRDAKRIAELEAQINPLIRQSALLEPCQDEVARLKREQVEDKNASDIALADLKMKLEAAHHENAQLKTAKMGWEFFRNNASILRKMADDLDEEQANGSTQT